MTMKVWAAWEDNGQGEAPSLIGLYATKEAAEEGARRETAGGGTFGTYTEEIEIEIE